VGAVAASFSRARSREAHLLADRLSQEGVIVVSVFVIASVGLTPSVAAFVFTGELLATRRRLVTGVSAS
jgi:hypothetical protein